MGRSNAILEKYADHLRHRYPKWDVAIIHRVNNGTAGVWGVVQLDIPGRQPILLRVHPWYGVDRVQYRGDRFFRDRRVLTKQQLQMQFGMAPGPRRITRELFPFNDLAEGDELLAIGGEPLEGTT